jgi:mannose-P-dolichol utilization defect protein 1
MGENNSEIILNLPKLISAPITQIIGEACYTTLIAQLNFTDVNCLRYTLSKVLGIGIVIGGSIVKLPQLVKIHKYKSTEGISKESYSLETLNYTINIAYNLRILANFSTWGECLSILVQNLIVLSLIIFYGGELGKLKSILKLNFGFIILLISLYYVNFSVLVVLQTFTIPLHSVSKVPQILKNYKQKSTGKLSKFTLLTYFAGSLARVFTTWVEVNDMLILSSNIFAFAFNGILLWQLVYYELMNKKLELPRINGSGENNSIFIKIKKGTKLI